MCGIFGLVGDGCEPARESLTKIGLRSIDRRGPDGWNVFRSYGVGGAVTLGHSRLAVLDLSSRAKQPMEHTEGGFVITYNGEIYNYLEIRHELERLGHSFISDGDTEVLLKAWVQWGLNALSRLNGMFAFAVHSRTTGEVWLVRDRFGVKPLLWGELEGGGAVFSSSVAAVARSIKAEVDIDYCARGVRYKAFETIDSGSPFSNVNSVPPGGWVKFDLARGRVTVTSGQWYDLASAVADKKRELKDWSSSALLTECSALFEAAVNVRLRSDVPIAVSLSGGLDSSSIAALAAKKISGLRGFTYGSPDDVKSEGPVVSALAEQLGIEVEYIWPNANESDLDALLEQTLRCQEAPFVGLSVLAQNHVFSSVHARGCKVLMGGQGGDESFAGYRKFFVVTLKAALRSRDPIRIMHAIYSLGRMLMAETSQLSIYWNSLGRYRSDKVEDFQLLDWEPRLLSLWGQPGADLADRQIEDIQRFSIPTLLRYEDRNSMGHGVETRLPFMDYQLVELALALPDKLKIAHGFGKWALRDITYDLVPDFIRLNRKKRGFDVTQDWVRDGIGQSLRSRIMDQCSVLQPYLKKEINYKDLLSDANLANDRNLLDEALMLAWLIEPLRMPVAKGCM